MLHVADMFVMPHMHTCNGYCFQCTNSLCSNIMCIDVIVLNVRQDFGKRMHEGTVFTKSLDAKSLSLQQHTCWELFH